jgi:hypothetical protein
MKPEIQLKTVVSGCRKKMTFRPQQVGIRRIRSIDADPAK